MPRWTKLSKPNKPLFRNKCGEGAKKGKRRTEQGKRQKANGGRAFT